MQLCSLYGVGSNILQSAGKFSLFQMWNRLLYSIYVVARMIQKVYSLKFDLKFVVCWIKYGECIWITNKYCICYKSRYFVERMRWYWAREKSILLAAFTLTGILSVFM